MSVRKISESADDEYDLTDEQRIFYNQLKHAAENEELKTFIRKVGIARVIEFLGGTLKLIQRPSKIPHICQFINTGLNVYAVRTRQIRLINWMSLLLKFVPFKYNKFTWRKIFSKKAFLEF